MESYIQQFSIMVVPILIAVTFHELAHGMVAYKLGDPTAKNAGRLTLNPLAHLDPVGTLVFVITRMIGWAKPVPVNPVYFRDPRRGMLWVALAGPATNLVLALFSAVFYILLYNMAIPADSFMSSLKTPIFKMCEVSIYLNVGLAVFNFIPIPPLDGGRVMVGILPERQAVSYAQIEPYGFIILILLLITKVVDYVIFPVINFAVGIILLLADLAVG